jgi:hypothetical protein
MSIDTFSANASKKDQDIVVPLLYNPLPVDLSTVQKDLLIIMAAVQDNIDRYARLRRPFRVETEVPCGCTYLPPPSHLEWVAQQLDAGDARFNMSNNLERITPDTKGEELPYLIWHPHFAVPCRRRTSSSRKSGRMCVYKPRERAL